MYRYGPSYRCCGLGPGGGVAQRKGCGNTIPLAQLDGEITDEFLAADDLEHVETVIPGSDHSEEIAAVQLAIKDLDLDAEDYDERHAALVTELRHLRSLPVEPEKRVSIYTNRTEGEAFAEMTKNERRAFIRQWKLTVWPKDAEHETALAAAMMGRRWTLYRRP